LPCVIKRTLMRATFIKALLVGGMLGLASLSHAQFTTIQIGNDAPGSITANGAGSYSVIGGGDDIWSAGDDFTYHYVNVNGDFDVRMRIESLEMAATWTKAGIMAREDFTRGSRMVWARSTPTGGANDLHLGYRTVADDGPSGEHEDGGGTPAYPNCWVRLKRTGNHILGYSSSDGLSWNLLGDQDTAGAAWLRAGVQTPFDNPTHVGIAVSRHSGSLTTVHCEIRDYGSTSDDPVISKQPANNAANSGQTASFSVDVAGGYDFVSFQWKRDGTDIGGATSRSYTTPPLVPSDNGAHFSVAVHNNLNNSTTLSSDAILGVDVPGIVAVGSLGRTDQICIRFTKAIAPADAANSSLYAVNNGVVVNSSAASPSDPNVVELSVSTLTVGTTYTVTAHDVHDTGGSVQSPNPASASFQNTGYEPVKITVRRYENIGGAQAVSQLTSSPKFPNSPDFTSYNPTEFNNPATSPNLEGFGAQIKGWYVAPASGNYQFGVASDDNSQLFVSTDADPAHKVMVASVPDWSDVREFQKFGSQISGNVPLLAGNTYYMELLYKEGGGGDHGGATVRRPGDAAIVNGTPYVQSSQFTADPSGLWLYNGNTPYIPGDIALTAQPADAHVVEGSTVIFSTDITGTPPYNIVWYDNGVAIPNSNTKNLSVFATPSNDGHTFHAVVQNTCSQATTRDASLTVDIDTINPTIVDAGCDPVDKKIRVLFSEPVTAASATDLGNYALDSGLTVDAAQLLSDNKTVLLTASSSLIPNQLYSLSVQGIVDRSITGNLLDATNVPITGCICSNGVILVEMWRGDSGPNVFQTLTNNPKFPNNPDNLYFLNTPNWAQTPNAYFTAGNEENYGLRMKGYVLPSVTGNYRFQVHADDSGFFAISTDSNPANLQQLINRQGDCGACTAVNSASVTLNAGQAYYFESMFEEGGGGDYLELRWSLGAAAFDFIPGANLAYCYDPQKTVLEINGLTDPTVEACRPMVLAPSYNITPGQGVITYQWMREAIDIPGATSPSYTIPHVSDSDNGAMFQVRVSALLRDVVSNPVFLTVLPDADVPTIVGANADIGRHHVIVHFSEDMDVPSSTDPSFYQVSGPSGNLTLTAAAISNGSNVVITTFEALEEGADYTVSIVGGPIMDLCFVNQANVGDQATFKGFVFVPGIATFRTYDTGGGNTVNLLTGSPLFPDKPRELRYINGVDTRLVYPDDTHEAYGGIIEGFIVPPVTGNFTFYLSSDDSSELWLNKDGPDTGDPTGAVKIQEETGCCNPPSAHASASITLNAGQRYYIKGLWKEGVGGDFMQVRAKLSADPANPDNLTPIGPDYIGMYVDPAIVPSIAPTLPTSGMLPIGSLARRGFDLHTVQVGTNIDNLLSIAELLLAGNGGPNLSTLPFSLESGIINYTIDGATYGSIPGEKPFPGIPGSTASTDNIAMEALTYVELQQGFHSFVVNSDDGFRVTPALCAADPNNAMVLGAFDGGRGASDTPFVFYVPTTGLYPMRLVWEQGGGGGNVEWVDVRQGTYPTRVAVNGDDNIKAFSASQFTAVQSGSNLIISWNSTVDCPYRLQKTDALQTPSSATIWTDVPGGSPASVPIGPGSAIFRLIRP
jgi:hypothetical protein